MMSQLVVHIQQNKPWSLPGHDRKGFKTSRSQTDVIWVQITKRTYLSPFSLYSAIPTVLSSVWINEIGTSQFHLNSMVILFQSWYIYILIQDLKTKLSAKFCSQNNDKHSAHIYIYIKKSIIQHRNKLIDSSILFGQTFVYNHCPQVSQIMIFFNVVRYLHLLVE